MTMTKADQEARQHTGGSRFIVRETGDGLGIVVPMARKKGLVFLLGMLLVYWAGFGIFSAYFLQNLVRQEWFAAWLAAGVVCIGTLGWKLFATERLFITGGALVLSRGLGFLSRRSIFLLDEVTKTRIRTRYVPTGNKGSVTMRSVISFEVRGKTYDFGADMEPDERSAVYHAMLRHLPPQAREAEEVDNPETADR